LQRGLRRIKLAGMNLNQPLSENEATMIKEGRRKFLAGTGVALAGVTAGSVNAFSGSSGSTQEVPLMSAGFGWEIRNINDNGADAYFQVAESMILSAANIDVAFMITGAPTVPGYAEVLCGGAVSRGGPPSFYSGPQAYTLSPNSPNFGNVQIYNPNGLSIGNDYFLLQDQFYQVILKTWVPLDGTASSTHRQVRVTPSLQLNSGDYLVFHMDHLGVEGDVEMQVVLEYSLASQGWLARPE
jgi:hypothetical protein